MARKRVSLKDKDPEILGLTQKKGRGVDVLFGGSTAGATASNAETKNDVTNLADDVAVAPPPVPSSVVTSADESLPVNEADHELAGVIPPAEGMTDDFGLPVAMEAPPAPSLSANATAREVDELGLPVAMEAPLADITMPVSISAPPPIIDEGQAEVDLSGLAPVHELPAGPGSELTGLEGGQDLAGVVTDDDLSGLVEESDLSGLAPEVDTTPAAAPIPPAEASPFEPTSVPPFEPVAAPPPILSPEFPPSFQDTTVPAATPVRPAPEPPPVASPYTPPLPVAPPPPVEQPVSVPPIGPPGPAAAAPPSSLIPSYRIESFGGLATEGPRVSAADLLPEDLKVSEQASNVLEVIERAKVERDDLITEKVARYVGKERRANLDKEIEQLYEAVAAELSDNKEDSAFALKTLGEAQNILLEDVRQYDEAVYRVAVVKTMLVRKQNLRHWSYTWGLFVLGYAVFWLIVFIAGFVLTDALRTMMDTVVTSESVQAIRAAWFSALAGGIGGVIGILYSLYWHVAYKQDFDRQYVMYYLVQPIMGFVLGAVVYFIITAGFLFANSSAMLGTGTATVIQVVAGWIAGFRQRLVYELIDKIVQKVSPKSEDSTPISLAPADQIIIKPPDEK